MSSMKRPSIRVGPAVDFQATDAVHSGLGAGFAVKLGIRTRAVRSLWKGFSNFESTCAIGIYRDSSPIEEPLRRGYL